MSCIVVTGLIGEQPIAGQTCHYLQYVLGLRDLGHEVWYIEDGGAIPYHPVREVTDDDYSYSLPYLSNVMSRYGLDDQWVYMKWDGTYCGRERTAVREVYQRADLLLNVSGATLLDERHLSIPQRVYIDTDPHMTQIKLALRDPATLAHVGAHTHHFTFAGNIGRLGCALPPNGFSWKPTRQPVHLPLWAAPKAPGGTAYTTVTNWNAYGGIEFDGVVFGGKDEEFRRFADLPALLSRPALLALPCTASSGAEAASLLRGHGWRVCDALPVTADIAAYVRFLQESWAEIGIAKNGYVRSRSGWFSERDANYLACGRPVLTQETGFSDWLPTGTGVVAFSTLEEACAGDEAITKDYDRHCRAALRLAQDWFDARHVLRDLLAECDL
jgi:hypothetical protein